MQVKKIQVLICFSIIWLVTVSCKEDSLLGRNDSKPIHNGPNTITYGMQEKNRAHFSDINGINNEEEAIRANLFNTDNKQNGIPSPNGSDKSSSLDIVLWESKIIRWAEEEHRQLDKWCRKMCCIYCDAM